MLGSWLALAWRQANLIGPVDCDELPRDREEAYFVQDRMAAHIDEPLSGWKVGATSARMRELDGHDDVVPGRIFQSVTHVSNDVILSAERYPGARAETEFAFRLSSDLPLRAKPWTAVELAPLVTLHPAIEIIGNRHELPEAPKHVRSLMTVADNGGGIGFVFGDPVADWRGIDFQNHEINLRVDGGTAAENFLDDMRCVPIEALAALANHLAGRGIMLHAGDFISTGAATVPQPVSKGSKVDANFGSLGRIRVSFQ